MCQAFEQAVDKTESQEYRALSALPGAPMDIIRNRNSLNRRLVDRSWP